MSELNCKTSFCFFGSFLFSKGMGGIGSMMGGRSGNKRCMVENDTIINFPLFGAIGRELDIEPPGSKQTKGAG